MANVSSFANIGDTVIFKKRGKWQDGWKVVGVTHNEHGFVVQVIVDKGGRAKQQLHLFDDKTLVFVEPPKGEALGYDDILKDYPNLRVVRRRAAEPPAYMLFCMECHEVLTLQQRYSEVSEIVLWKGRVQTSKPQIDDGHEEVTCDCEGKTYEIEYEGYW